MEQFAGEKEVSRFQRLLSLVDVNFEELSHRNLSDQPIHISRRKSFSPGSGSMSRTRTGYPSRRVSVLPPETLKPSEKMYFFLYSA